MMKEKKLPTAEFASECPEEEAVNLGFITIQCPYCKGKRKIEPDGYYDDIECEICGKHFRTVGVI